jgi:hypothetical protein
VSVLAEAEGLQQLVDPLVEHLVPQRAEPSGELQVFAGGQRRVDVGRLGDVSQAAAVADEVFLDRALTARGRFRPSRGP